MREQKYRAWDGEKMDYDYRDACLWNGLLVAEGDTILMQSTGLKDRNDTEIWESDIVRVAVHSQPMFVVYQSPEFVCKWKTPKGNISTASSDLAVYLEGKEPRSFYEVIGNLFEHPHLLQPQEYPS